MKRHVSFYGRSLWLVALVVVGTAVSAHAQSDDERARTHFEAGSSYYDQARYADAAREFQASYNLSPHPELLLNICHYAIVGGRG